MRWKTLDEDIKCTSDDDSLNVIIIQPHMNGYFTVTHYYREFNTVNCLSMKSLAKFVAILVEMPYLRDERTYIQPITDRFVLINDVVNKYADENDLYWTEYFENFISSNERKELRRISRRIDNTQQTEGPLVRNSFLTMKRLAQSSQANTASHPVQSASARNTVIGRRSMFLRKPKDN